MRRTIYGASVARALLPLQVTAGAAGAAHGTGPGGAPGERATAAPAAASAAANGGAGGTRVDRHKHLNGLGTGDAAGLAHAGAPDHRAGEPATGEAAASGGGAGAAADVEAGIDGGPRFVAEARVGDAWSALPGDAYCTSCSGMLPCLHIASANSAPSLPCCDVAHV